MAGSSTGSSSGGGNVILTGGTTTGQGGSVTITAGSGVTGTSGGVTLTGQSGKITLGTAPVTRQHAYGNVTNDAGQWSTVATTSDMDQLRLEMFDLQQTVRALMRQNQRLSDELEALKAGAILDPPNLA